MNEDKMSGMVGKASDNEFMSLTTTGWTEGFTLEATGTSGWIDDSF